MNIFKKAIQYISLPLFPFPELESDLRPTNVLRHWRIERFALRLTTFDPHFKYTVSPYGKNKGSLEKKRIFQYSYVAQLVL